MKELSAVPIERLAYWIEERERIRVRKEKLHWHPMRWTEDPIFAKYRFCNAHREDDRVTRWIAANWRTPHADNPLLWHAMLIARYINWPPTLAECGWPEPWRSKRQYFVNRLLEREKRGEKVFTGAYIVSTNGLRMAKSHFVIDLFDTAAKHEIKLTPTTRLAGFYNQLTSIKGVGTFMAAQIVSDVKQVGVLRGASDWNEWCAPGPGSMRGLNRVLGKYLQQKWPIGMFIPAVQRVRHNLRSIVEAKTMSRLCLQDLQNCLCEFDKYERVRLGEGRPRATYSPSSSY